MVNEVYSDISITSAKRFLRLAGAAVPKNGAEKTQIFTALFCSVFAGMYGLYANSLNVYYHWGTDMTYSIYSCSNFLCAFLATSKVIVLRTYRFELADIIAFAERHFWHYNYDSEEILIFQKYRDYCKLIIALACTGAASFLIGLTITPILSNIGHNKSERELVFRMSFDWSSAETSYYEIILLFQIICVAIVCNAYICPDTILCILNLHTIAQFRILHYRMTRFWDSSSEETGATRYADRCSAALKKCIELHQMLIEFCKNLEYVFTLTILFHMVVFSLLMGLDSYELFMSDASPVLKTVYIFHVSASFFHLAIFTSTCHGLIEESNNVNTVMYLGSWYTLPMNKCGKSLRLNTRIVMIRSLKPCCLTIGGFSPVSLKTFTKLASSTFSYFTLMRESFLKNENE